jgi:predicted transcriptional regulator
MLGPDPSLENVLRILRVLEETDDIGMTTLALVTRLNHHRCIPTVKWMTEHGFLIVRADGSRGKRIRISDTGWEYIKILRQIPLPEI